MIPFITLLIPLKLLCLSMCSLTVLFENIHLPNIYHLVNFPPISLSFHFITLPHAHEVLCSQNNTYIFMYVESGM